LEELYPETPLKEELIGRVGHDWLPLKIKGRGGFGDAKNTMRPPERAPGNKKDTSPKGITNEGGVPGNILKRTSR